MTDWVFKPICVLYDFDCPLLFVFKHEEELFLGYMSDHDILLAVKTTPDEVTLLEDGEVPLLDVLSKNEVWRMVSTRSEDTWTNVTLLKNGMDDIPVGYKPQPGVKLRL